MWKAFLGTFLTTWVYLLFSIVFPGDQLPSWSLSAAGWGWDLQGLPADRAATTPHLHRTLPLGKYILTPNSWCYNGNGRLERCSLYGSRPWLSWLYNLPVECWWRGSHDNSSLVTRGQQKMRAHSFVWGHLRGQRSTVAKLQGTVTWLRSRSSPRMLSQDGIWLVGLKVSFSVEKKTRMVNAW